MRLQSQWQARYCQCRSEQERVRRFPGCSPAPAYRGDLLEKRRWLMEAWAPYAGATIVPGKVVVPMQRSGEN